MKKFIVALLHNIVAFALSLRYRVEIKGLDNLNKQNLKKKGGLLFLPNHPTVFVDPTLCAQSLRHKFPVRPMIVEYMYYQPIINKVMKELKGIPVPDFDTPSNSIKKKKLEKTLNAVVEGLEAGDNFLIYPGARTKSTKMEVVTGSGVPYILQASPNVNVILVRIKGLWGSSFSRAFTGGSPPNMFKSLLHGIVSVFKNLLFFTPRRKVILEFVPAPDDFPIKGTRLEINRYLENWYNKPDGFNQKNPKELGDTLCLVSYSMWSKNDIPEIKEKVVEKSSIDINAIPKSIQENIIKKVSEISELPIEKIKPNLSLSADIGFDSLDIAEMIAFIDDEYEVKGVYVKDIDTVASVMAYAAGIIKPSEEKVEEKINQKGWFKPRKKTKCEVPQGDTIPEIFIRRCDISGSQVACADARTGTLTYSQAKMRVLLLAEEFKKLPGKNVGILLPPSVVTYLVILACQMAGKIPVMINWTVGPRHLEVVQNVSKLEAVLSSWAFVDRLENVQFDGLEDKMVLLEDLKHEITLTDKIRAFYRSKLGVKSLFKIFGLGNLKSSDPAVQLYTSGTENMPKGVPLSHSNILSNIRNTLKSLEIFNDDILLGILPPFHSFGFTVSGILPFLTGFRVAFYPDPTDGTGVAQSIALWKATAICGAPTFLKGFLKAAKPGELDSLRLIITGAEKAPTELNQLIKELTKASIVEGYGITECSPVLTVNASGKSEEGVGRPIPEVDISIVNLTNHEKLKQGEQGLIIVRGPNIFQGYLNKDISSPFINVDNKSWYSTGDLGYLDPKGNLIISGRLKRFVKIGGEMLSLSAIESSLFKALEAKTKQEPVEGPTLALCSVEEPGEKSKLYLYTTFSLTPEEANKALRDSGFSNIVRISDTFKLPMIPIMGTGKVNYRELQNQLTQQIS